MDTISELEIQEFVDDFLECEVNLAVLESGTEEQITKEIFEDTWHHFGFDVGDELRHRLFNLIWRKSYNNGRVADNGGRK